jgi:hypothetical protein
VDYRLPIYIALLGLAGFKLVTGLRNGQTRFRGAAPTRAGQPAGYWTLMGVWAVAAAFSLAWTAILLREALTPA